MYGRAGWWWHKRHDNDGECGAEAGCGPGGGGWAGRGWRGHGGGGWEAAPGGGDHEGGSFGVRRPLRFLAWKLELSEEQIAELAKILNDLKTERAQAAVDDRRVTASFADAISRADFDASKVKEAAEARAKTAARLAAAVESSLAKIHAILDDEQRKQLAYLIRTGTLTI